MAHIKRLARQLRSWNKDERKGRHHHQEERARLGAEPKYEGQTHRAHEAGNDIDWPVAPESVVAKSARGPLDQLRRVPRVEGYLHRSFGAGIGHLWFLARGG